MKFRHLVRFTRSCYLTVDYDVYRMSRAHFSHFSFTTEKVLNTLMSPKFHVIRYVTLYINQGVSCT